MADATSTPDAADHDVQIEDVGPALKRLTITIPGPAVSEKIEESIGTLSQEAALPGFRRGKAPRKLLERRFGHTVRDETKNRLIADAYAKAIEDHGIKPVSEPEPTEPPEKLKLEAYAVIEDRSRPYTIDWTWSTLVQDEKGEWKGPQPGITVKIGASISDPATGNRYAFYHRGDPPPDSLTLVIQDASGKIVHRGTMEYG